MNTKELQTLEGGRAAVSNISWTAEELARADRALLVHYLQSWGYMVYDHETLDELRAAAQHNVETEGPGLGPNADL